MGKMKHFYEIREREFVAHSNASRILILQHEHPIYPNESGRDMQVYISRADAPRVIEAIQQWLDDTDQTAPQNEV